MEMLQVGSGPEVGRSTCTVSYAKRQRGAPRSQHVITLSEAPHVIGVPQASVDQVLGADGRIAWLAGAG